MKSDRLAIKGRQLLRHAIYRSRVIDAPKNVYLAIDDSSQKATISFFIMVGSSSARMKKADAIVSRLSASISVDDFFGIANAVQSRQIYHLAAEAACKWTSSRHLGIAT